MWADEIALVLEKNSNRNIRHPTIFFLLLLESVVNLVSYGLHLFSREL